ncbi:MFS transporter [Paenibacillus hamazuiensis]|uniref:MFS transporter n=1 Tax=Paenibacillus hamazuiensis TaxID=2936508 RepID=UPI00200DCDC0|nr:MFS transporter [Paenibacillus hamazuiensis]
MNQSGLSGIRKSFVWLGILAFFSVLNETLFNVALPDIAAEFSIAPSAANWANTGFMLSFAVGTAVYGKISDHVGVKKLLLIGLLTYGGGSLLGFAFHYRFPLLVVARFIQGAGASAVPGLIMVIVTRYIEPKHQGKAFGTIGSIVALGEGIGPVIGGAVAEHIHWSYLFLVPMMTLLSLPFFLRTLPREPSKAGKPDALGASLLSLGILAFTLFTTTYQWMILIASALLLAGFALRIRRAEQPFVEPALLARKNYICVVLAGAIWLGTAAGFIAMVPYLMKNVYHMPTGLIGSGILFPGTAAVFVFGILGGTLADKRGTAFTLNAGLCLMGASFALASLLADQAPWLISCAVVLAFGGLSFVKTVISTRSSAALNSEEAGSGMGFLNFACFMAEGIGVAAVGGLLAKNWLNVQLLPTVNEPAAFLYSNVTLLFAAALLVGKIVFSRAGR